VEVQSRPGAGAEFRVLLPAVTAPGVIPAPALPPPVTLAGRGRRLLVVDDEETIRLVTAETLSRHGFVVETAADGVEALEKFHGRSGEFAAVLTDLMMPRMSGQQLAAEIRRTHPAVPIITSTGVAGAAGAEAAEAGLAGLGIRTRLTKPYTERELLRCLADELASPPGQKKD
jgi:CheY-like chemotaxis protein